MRKKTDSPEGEKEYGDSIKFLMIDCEEDEYHSDVLEFLDDYGYVFPVCFDSDWSAYDKYGNGYVPLIDKLLK